MQLPAFAIKRLIAPLNRWRAGMSAESGYLRKFRRSQFWSAVEIQKYQRERIQAQLQYAFDRCPFYRTAHATMRIRASELQGIG